MLTATASAISGSSGSQPVIATAATPTITPAEVHTSVIRCRPSASTTIERARRPERTSSRPTDRLIADATAETAMPRPTSSIGCGSRSRATAVTAMPTAATRISAPSTPAEKYSAF